MSTIHRSYRFSITESLLHVDRGNRYLLLLHILEQAGQESRATELLKDLYREVTSLPATPNDNRDFLISKMYEALPDSFYVHILWLDANGGRTKADLLLAKRRLVLASQFAGFTSPTRKASVSNMFTHGGRILGTVTFEGQSQEVYVVILPWGEEIQVLKLERTIDPKFLDQADAIHAQNLQNVLRRHNGPNRMPRT